VGTTATDRTTDDGVSVNGYGFVDVSRSSNISGRFTRRATDGAIVQFRQDSTEVGSIGAYFGAMYIGSPTGTDGHIRLGQAELVPATSTGANRDNYMDLGSSSARFKDLYLSGTASIGNLTIAGAQGTDGQLLTSTGSGIAWEDAPASGPSTGKAIVLSMIFG